MCKSIEQQCLSQDEKILKYPGLADRRLDEQRIDYLTESWTSSGSKL